MMPRNRGAMVQVGTALAYRGTPLQSAYGGAKHAIQGFTGSVRCELLHDRSGVHITMVQLPALNTPQFAVVKSRLPRRAQPVPPIYQPEVAARAIEWAADHPYRHESWVGATTAATILANDAAPGLLDRYLALTGVKAQQTDEQEDPRRPNNLFGPVPGDHGAHGDFDAHAHAHSPEVVLSTKKRLFGLTALGAAVGLDLRASPRFDYGEVQPWFRREGAQLYSAIGGAQGLLFASDFPMERVDRHNLAARIIARAGERARLSIRYVEPELLDEQPAVPPEQHELDGRLDETLTWWEQWASEAQFDGPYVAGAIRSAAVLKALTFAPTGAIAAAPTASLPALIPGDANWDYRYSWVRDSTFTVRALFELGYEKEPEGFRRFVERSAAGTGTDIQVVYGIGGERRLTEMELEHLEGYRGCAPVRIGNGAWRQEQLDVYGEAMDLAWRWYERGRSPDED